MYYLTKQIKGDFRQKFQDLKEPKRILEHAKTNYLIDAMGRAQQFIDSYQNPKDYKCRLQTKYANKVR